jgi:uncharacterized protein
VDIPTAGNSHADLSDAPDISGAEIMSPDVHPERKCILSGAHNAPEMLLRLALGPDNQLGADFAAKLPGRGAWISLDRAQLETAITKGKFRGALARAFKLDAGKIIIPDDFVSVIEKGLAARALNRLGLEKRAGFVVMGADQVEGASNSGKARLLIHAGDAAVDGMRKLKRHDEFAVETVQVPCTRVELGLALGRDAVVHCGIIDSRAATRCRIDIQRWLAYGAGSKLDKPAASV